MNFNRLYVHVKNVIFSSDLFSFLKGLELRELRNSMRFLEVSLHTPWCETEENPVHVLL